MKVLVLGAGKMVEAILQGLAKKQSLTEWGIYTPSGVSAQKLALEVGATFVADLNSFERPDWILLGCKPQQLTAVAQGIKGKYKESLFLSLLAAVSESDQIKILDAGKLVRVMPNLSVRMNEGVILLASASAQDKLNLVQKEFSKIGSAIVMKESELDELTILTGSGPGLFYEFTKSLAASFESLDEKTREELARQVLRGAALSLNPTQSLDEMVGAVTSKAGVTIAVLEKWRSEGFRDFLKKGVLAGISRAKEISKTILQN